MPDGLNFDEIFAQINRLFEEKQYEAVITTAAQHVGAYPDRKPLLQYLQMCAAARQEDRERVCEILEEALFAGSWYSEEALRESPSLRPLVGLPEYESLLALSAEIAAGDASQGEHLIVETPENKEGPYPLLIALHQNGGSAVEARSAWLGLVEEGMALAFPQSSRALWKGSFNWNDKDAAAKEIANHYQRICREYDVDRQHVIIAGHSMGAQLAIWLALSGTVKAKGFIAVGPYLPQEELEGWVELFEKRQGCELRGAILFGENDHTIPNGSIYNLVESLQKQCVEVKIERLPGVGHDFAPEFRQRLPEAVDFVL